jgi:ribonucleotide reductase beta subunit family protein with ferritin-like domain
MKDETLSHVQLFKELFRTAVEELYNGIVPVEVVNKAKHMILDMTKAEKRWTKYASKGLTGFTDRTIDIFVEGQANSVCGNLGLPMLFKKEKENPLKRILTKYLKGGSLSSRSNFFEGNVADYSKGTLIMDF